MNNPPPLPAQAPIDGWRTVTQITWVLVFISMIVIVISSRTIGRPIWWLGASTNPAPLYNLVIPLVIVLTPFIAARRNVARLGLVSIGCSLLLALSAIPDISASPAIATATICVAAAALVGSIAVVVATRDYR